MTPADATYARQVKRLLDIAGSVMLLVILSPIYALCSILILWTSGRPIHFHQVRVGRGERHFRVHKFRTMVIDAEARSNNYPTADMVTPVGDVLRRLSLDELPQLFNILRGEMSFVGPRPALPSQVQRYTPRQRERLSVLPGLTGLAQVRHRNNAPWSVRIESDLEYISCLSFGGDLRILIMTVPRALRGEGVVIGQTASDVDDLAQGPGAGDDGARLEGSP